MAQTAGSLRVVSQRKDGTGSTFLETVIAIDRRNPILGNRHYLRNHNDAVEREQVIKAHAQDVEADERQHGPISQELEKIASMVANGDSVALECWCTPRHCHGHTYCRKISAILERWGVEGATIETEAAPSGKIVKAATSPPSQGTLF